ncbi:sensor histidine kinase [Streptomyces sp. NPDC050504]|uniref:sensor histidine kinase n=1 Tax=Streptomyces sp. NPDC050504 TaxID=3365618 RepID=UPI003788FC7B
MSVASAVCSTFVFYTDYTVDLGYWHHSVIVLIWVASASLLLSRRFPLPVFLLTLALFLVPAANIAFPFLVSTAMLMLYGGSARWLVLCGAAFLYFVTPQRPSEGLVAPAMYKEYTILFVVVAPALFGESTRRYRVAMEVMRARVARAQATTSQAADLAVLEERTRIAWHAHDVLGHRLTVLTLQAAALGTRVGDDPDLRERAGLIETVSREAMADVRSILNVFSSPASAASTEDIGRFLGSLVRNLRATGMDVTPLIEEGIADMPGDQALLLQRAAREGLTNATKYAAGAQVVLELYTDRDEIHLRLTNTRSRMRSGLRDSGGLGLTGLRKSYEQAGGSLHANATSHGGFRLHCTLPYRPADDS